jgi:hypothetical protein
MDIVLERIRPLAAPLVLSSRRLDAPAAPGQSVPPGAYWEVIVAQHTEQALVEKNRALVNHLGFRQVAHALVRSISDPAAFDNLRGAVVRAVSPLFPSGRARVPNKYSLIVGSASTPIDLAGLTTLDRLVTAINAVNAGVTASLTAFRIVLTPFGATSRLQLSTVVGTTDTDLAGTVFPAANAPVPQMFKLVVGPTTTAIDLGGPGTLDQLVAAINALNAGARATTSPVLVLTAAQPVFPLRLLSLDGPTPTDIVSEVIDLAPGRFETVVNSVPKTGPKQLEPPALPAGPVQLEHLDLNNLSGDDALSLDLPLRSAQFTQGLVALQWRALPYYYKYKLLLIAQSSAVVSPITAVDQRDFQYVSPTPAAVMEGDVVAQLEGSTRRRRITIPLARYWDCLPPDAQQRWGAEDPASVENGDPQSTLRRHSSLPDPDVIYQVVLMRPSGNVEVLAEYRSKPDAVAGYESRPLPGPFRGDAVRLLPAADGPGAGSKRIALETLLTPVGDPNADNASVIEPVSGRAAFAQANANGVAVTLPLLQLSACVLRLDRTLPDPARAAILAMIAAGDPSFAQALRQLLAQPGPSRYAEACIGLEQLAEIQDAVTIDAVARTVTWKGPISTSQQEILSQWVKTSLFQATLTKLLGFQTVETYPADPKNPVQSDISLPPDRLAIAPDRLVWSRRLTVPASPAEIGALNTLKAKAGLPQPVVQALTALVADVGNDPGVTATVPIQEPFWTLRPTQATLPPELKDLLFVGNGLLGFQGLMTRAEGTALQGLAGLTAPDRDAVARLFVASMNGGLGGGSLAIRARRGSAAPISVVIAGALAPATP